MGFFEKVTEVLKPVGKEAAKAVKNMAISILRKKNAKFRFCPKCGKEIKEKKGKFCPNCGTPTNGARFCSNCGTKLA